MMKLLLLILLLVSFPANAQKPLTITTRLENGTLVTLVAQSCTNKKVLEQVKPEYQPLLHNGSYTAAGGRPEAICWLILPDGTIVVVDEKGDYATLPLSQFAPQKVQPGI